MRSSHILAALSAAVLVACGGGGGSSTPAGPGVDPNAATVSLSGVAAKGLMANADVKVYAVKSDGTVDTSTVLGTATTDAKGQYTLSFAATKDQPYVITVTAKADGSTTHLDEVSGTSQALPSGFTMRAVLVPASGGTVTTSTSVTPFSEMAVAAAAKASGGVTTANAKQALSTVTQLLGFDPSTVKASALTDATTSDEKKLAVMLTAVSQLANSGDLGCGSGSNGDKTKCVVEKLAASTSKDSIKLSTGSTDVSSTLSTALNTVLSDDKVRGKVDASTLTTVVANLGCSTNCAAAPTGTTTQPSATATAIAAAKLLFGQIKTDWAAMFSRGGATSLAGGAVNKEAVKFNNALTGAQIPLEALAKDVGTLLLGVDLYNDYKAGRTSSPSRGRGDGSLVTGNGTVPAGATVPVGCTLYQDSNTTVTATSPSNANFIACAARYFASRATVGNAIDTTEWRHSFTVTPNVDGSFDYQTRARRRTLSCVGSTCTTKENTPLQVDATGTAIAPFAGKLTPTLSAAFGDITTFTLKGELAAAYVKGGNTLSGFKLAVDVSGTQTINSDGTADSTLAGSVQAQDSASVTTTSVTIKPGSTMHQVPVSVDAQGNPVSPTAATAVRSAGHTVGGLNLNIVMGTPTAEFEGVLSATDAAWDKSGTELQPTKAKLSGALRNLASTGNTEFIKGVFTASTTGWAGFDVGAPASSTNQYSVNASFVGSITATARPTIELSFASGWTNNGANAGDGTPMPVTMQYRTLVSGAPVLVVALTGDRDSQGNVTAFHLTEATSNLSMNWAAGAASADLMLSTTKVGTLDTKTGVLTFVDGSFISLDIGL